MSREHEESQDKDLLNRLVERYLEQSEAHGPSVLEQITEEYPQLADQVRDRIRVLDDLGMLPDSKDEFPESLGEFRLIEVIGRGGMGAVYRAVQEPLDREVALKVIRPEHLYIPIARERFRREIETIARLHHPGIVPIYSVGMEGELPYFTMEYIRGCTLDQLLQSVRGAPISSLDGTSMAEAVARSCGENASPNSWLFRGSWIDCCLRIILSVADALGHAHVKGVLHRDLKPGKRHAHTEGPGDPARLRPGLDRGIRKADEDRHFRRLPQLHVSRTDCGRRP